MVELTAAEVLELAPPQHLKLSHSMSEVMFLLLCSKVAPTLKGDLMTLGE